MRIFSFVLALLICLLPQQSEAAIPINGAVAVMDFGTRPGATVAEININNAEYTSSEYIIFTLAKESPFDIRDKDIVMEKLKAADLKTTGIIDPDTAKVIGEMLGVRYLVYGNVSGVTLSKQGGEVAAIKGISGGINVCTVEAHIIGRMMDIETGDIIMAAKGDGKSKSTYVKVKTTPCVAVNIGASKVTQDSVHNAIQKAGTAMAQDLLKRLGYVPPKGGKE